MGLLGVAFEAVYGFATDMSRLARLQPLVPHSYSKFRLIKNLAERTGARTLIETGTLYGVTAGRCAPHFERVYTIELSSELARKARRNLARHRNVEVVEGDAIHELPRVLERAGGPIVAFLDGHFSGGETAQGEFAEPACVEIEQLVAARDKLAGFIVDDFRCFGQLDGFPSKTALIASVEKHFNTGFKIDVQFDQVLVERC